MTYAWHDIGDGRQVYRRVETLEPKRSSLAMPSFISDALHGVQSMASGKFYDSKSALRAEYKAMGVTEIGNDTRPIEKRAPDSKANQEAVGRAIQKINQGYKPGASQ